jgi:hypothetical protein
VELAGTTPGNTATNHDQVLVSAGNVVLGGSTLAAAFSTFTPAGTEVLYIVNNTGAGTTTGAFAGLSDDALVTTYGGFEWHVTYDANNGGGDPLNGGNDVALYATAVGAAAVPEPTSLAVVGVGVAGLLLRRRRNA